MLLVAIAQDGPSRCFSVWVWAQNDGQLARGGTETGQGADDTHFPVDAA